MTTTTNLSSTQIEEKKDVFSMRATLAFVEDHADIYKEAIRRMMIVPHDGILYEKLALLMQSVPAKNLQFSPHHMIKLLAWVPKILRDISTLDHVDFSWSRDVCYPVFDEQGEWVNVKKQAGDEFLADETLDHQRILVGYTNVVSDESTATKIHISSIPYTVSCDLTAIFHYQVAVALHEFFHTIEFSRRDHKKRALIHLQDSAGHCFTLQDWWQQWEQYVILKQQSESVSLYADIYKKDLTMQAYMNRTGDHGSTYYDFTHALAEMICESFVGYMMDILPNTTGWTSFSTHMFGRIESPSVPYQLMHRLCTSTLLHTQ